MNRLKCLIVSGGLLMAVRSYSEISSIFKNIVLRLFNNQKLCKLLYYRGVDPLAGADIADTKTLLGNQVKVVPQLGTEEDTTAKVIILFTQAPRDTENNEITNMFFTLFVYVPFSEWIIKGDDLRVFAIISEIEASLHEKDVPLGLGKLKSEGVYLETINDYICSYRMEFKLDTYK